MISRSPGVVFALNFVQACNSPDGYGGYTNYINRPEAFVSSEHSDDPMYANGFLDYMRDDDKSDGLFTLMKDNVTETEVQNQADLFNESHANDCPLYQGVISFDNDFLKENRLMNANGTLDLKRLKDIARRGVVDMLKESHLNIDNVIWNGAIHTNTDNVHIHLALVEREKVHRRFDRIDVGAFDRLKSTVANQIIGDKNIKRITEIYQEIFTLLDQIPDDVPLQYNRERFQPYQRHVNAFVRGIINGSPELASSFREVSQLLEQQQGVYRQIYGEGKRHLWQNYKVNKETDFFSRAGNAVLSAIKESGLREEYQAYKQGYVDPFESGSPRRPGSAYRYPRRSPGQTLDDFKTQRRSYFGLSRSAAGVVRRSLNETKRHIGQLMAEYEREQNQKNARN